MEVRSEYIWKSFIQVDACRDSGGEAQSRRLHDNVRD